jgi:hypothetical protein
MNREERKTLLKKKGPHRAVEPVMMMMKFCFALAILKQLNLKRKHI